MDHYVRVSEILGRLKDLSHIHPTILDIKSQIGTEVHANIALEKSDQMVTFENFPRVDIHGNFKVDAEGNTIYEPRGFGYFLSFREWDNAIQPAYKQFEKRYYCNELMVTGQIDALIQLPGDNKLTLIDFKCSSQADFVIWNMQAHFYYYLLKQNGIDNLNEKFLWIRLKDDGKIPSTYTFQFDEKVLSRCIEEANKYWFEYENEKMLVL